MFEAVLERCEIVRHRLQMFSLCRQKVPRHTSKTDSPYDLLNPIRPFLPSILHPHLTRHRVHQVRSSTHDGDGYTASARLQLKYVFTRKPRTD